MESLVPWIVALSILMFIVILVVIIIAAIKRHEKAKYGPKYSFNQAQHMIKKDMPINEVVNMLGSSYDRSLLKDGNEKFTWKQRHRGSSWGVSYRGMHSRVGKSGYMSSIAVETKKGRVVSYRSNNVNVEDDDD